MKKMATTNKKGVTIVAIALILAITPSQLFLMNTIEMKIVYKSKPLLPDY